MGGYSIFERETAHALREEGARERTTVCEAQKASGSGGQLSVPKYPVTENLHGGFGVHRTYFGEVMQSIVFSVLGPRCREFRLSVFGLQLSDNDEGFGGSEQSMYETVFFLQNRNQMRAGSRGVEYSSLALHGPCKIPFGS